MQKDLHYPTQTKLKMKEDTLISKMDLISFVALTLIIRRPTVFIVFKITGIASGDQEIVNSLIGNSVVDNGKLKINAKHISFYKTVVV